jgi:hypothetical protein
MQLKKITKEKKIEWDWFSALYRETFTEQERASLVDIEKNVNANINEVVLAFCNNVPLGYYILSKNNNEYVLLWYIGVSIKAQGRGIGGLMLKYIIDDFKKNSTSPFLLLEAEGLQATWYKKFAFLTVNYPYYYPHFTDNGKTKCDLMVIPKEHNQSSLSHLTLFNFVNGLYVKVYGVKQDDIRLKEQLDRITEKEYIIN